MESRKVDKYTIYSNGTVHDDNYDSWVKPYATRYGYPLLKLFIGGTYSQLFLHETIAQLFMPNYNPKLQTVHIDGNKFNNDISNLTQKEYAVVSREEKAAGLPNYKVRSYNPYDMSTIDFASLDEAALYIVSIGKEDNLAKAKLAIFNATDDNIKTAYDYRWTSI